MAGWGTLFAAAGRRLGLDRWLPRAKSAASAKFAEASGFGMGGASGWTQDRHEQVRHYRAWVYIAIGAKARHLAMDEVQIATKITAPAAKSKGIDPSRLLPFAARQKALTPLAEGEELKVAGPEHPLRRLFADPNEPDVSFDTSFELTLFLELTGVGYLWAAQPNALGLPTELWVVPSPWVRPVRTGTKWVDYYEVRPYGSGASGFNIPAKDMIVFRRRSPWVKYDGYSPLTAGDHWIDTAETVDKLRLMSLQNGAFPSLTMEADNEKFVDPDGEELDRIMAKARARFQGVENAGNIIFNRNHFRTNALRGVSDLEIGFLQSSPQLRDMVLTLFGVPYTAAGIVGGATHENYDESMRAFHHGTINPEKRWRGQILTEKLAARYDPSLIAYYPDTTPADPAHELAVADTLYTCNAMSPNEMRKRYGMEPVTEPDRKSVV